MKLCRRNGERRIELRGSIFSFPYPPFPVLSLEMGQSPMLPKVPSSVLASCELSFFPIRTINTIVCFHAGLWHINILGNDCIQDFKDG